MGASSSKKHVGYYLKNKGPVTPWGVIHTCTLSEWIKHQATIWGSDPCINYTTRPEHRLQPWATRGRHFVAQIPAPETQDIDMSASRMYATMAIEEKRNKYQVQCIDLPVSYFKDGIHFVEVIAYRDKHAVVEVATKHERMDFLLVDLDHDRVKVVHRQYCTSQPYLYECSISPDFSRIVLKPNHFYLHFHNIQSAPDVLKCVSIVGVKSSTNASRNEPNEDEIILNGRGSLRLAFTFDPRHKHSRIAIANIVENGKTIITIYDIDKGVRVLQNDLYTNTEQTAMQIIFSPGGNFIAAPLIIGDYQTTPPFNMADIKLFNANSLECLYTLPPRGSTGGFTALVPAATFPMFSSSGAFFISAVNKPHPDSQAYQCALCRVGSVTIHRVPPLMHLQSMCRTKIRLWVECDRIPYLPLPEALKRFLLFMPFQD